MKYLKSIYLCLQLFLLKIKIHTMGGCGGEEYNNLSTKTKNTASTYHSLYYYYSVAYLKVKC